MAKNKMEFWFEEMHTSNVKMSIRVDQHLYSGTSEFRRIDVFDSPEFGKFLTSDGNIIFSEKDEFTYDEMIVHVPMAVHPQKQRKSLRIKARKGQRNGNLTMNALYRSGRRSVSSGSIVRNR